MVRALILEGSVDVLQLELELPFGLSKASVQPIQRNSVGLPEHPVRTNSGILRQRMQFEANAMGAVGF